MKRKIMLSLVVIKENGLLKVFCPDTDVLVGINSSNGLSEAKKMLRDIIMHNARKLVALKKCPERLTWQKQLSKMILKNGFVFDR